MHVALTRSPKRTDVLSYAIPFLVTQIISVVYLILYSMCNKSWFALILQHKTKVSSRRQHIPFRFISLWIFTFSPSFSFFFVNFGLTPFVPCFQFLPFVCSVLVSIGSVFILLSLRPLQLITSFNSFLSLYLCLSVCRCFSSGFVNGSLAFL